MDRLMSRSKYAGIAAATLLLVVLTYVYLLLYPQMLFNEHIHYRNFSVHGNVTLTGMESILDEVSESLQTSSINDPALHHDIFFGHGHPLFQVLQNVKMQLAAAILGTGGALTYNASSPPRFSHVITFRIPDIPGNRLLHPDTGVAINLTRSVTHEITHTLLMARLGSERIRTTPSWKQEGYADYVAAQSSILAADDYGLQNSVARLRQTSDGWIQTRIKQDPELRRCPFPDQIIDEEGFSWPRCYYLARVLVENALDESGMSFDELFSPDTRSTELLAVLMSGAE